MIKMVLVKDLGVCGGLFLVVRYDLMNIDILLGYFFVKCVGFYIFGF